MPKTTTIVGTSATETIDTTVDDTATEPTDDTTTEPTDETSTELLDADANPDDQTPDDEPDEDWKGRHDDALAASRKWERRSKENKKALDAVTAERDALRKQLDGLQHDAQVMAWCDEVAAESGVPASVLRGDSLEEIKAHAETISKAYPSGRPVFTRHEGNPQETGARSIQEQIAAAQAAGDKQLVASLKALQLTSIAAKR